MKTQLLESFFHTTRQAAAIGQLARRNALHPVGYRIGMALGQVHQPLGHAQPSQAAAVARALVQRHQHGLGLVAQQFGIGQRAGRHHAHHLAVHRPLAADFAHLLANRHRFALADQLGQIALDRMKRHTGHRNRLPAALPPVRERDVQQARRFFGIGKKHLVKITHAVEQQRVRVVRLETQVLLHHGGVLGVGFAHRGKSSKCSSMCGGSEPAASSKITPCLTPLCRTPSNPPIGTR